MTTHSNILAWEVPCAEEPGGLQSMESQKVRHNLVTKQQQQERFEWIVHQRYAWKISEKWVENHHQPTLK